MWASPAACSTAEGATAAQHAVVLSGSRFLFIIYAFIYYIYLLYIYLYLFMYFIYLFILIIIIIIIIIHYWRGGCVLLEGRLRPHWMAQQSTSSRGSTWHGFSGIL